MEILLVYLCLINAASLLLMHADKKKAMQKQWRIPERVLLGCAIVGGSLGALLGMRIFRHKTLRPAFSVGIPVLLVVHIALLLYLKTILA